MPRMPHIRRWWAVDRFLLGWLGATAALSLLFHGRIPNAGWIAAGHLLALAAYLGAKRVAARNKVLLAVYLMSPFLLVLGIFQAMGLILGPTPTPPRPQRYRGRY